MIQKLKSKAGMTLMEVMVSLLIMVLLVVGMGTGMDAGMRVYADAHFESSSASLAGYINTSLTDMLRYAKDIDSTGTPLTFTNLEYGLRNAYLAPDTNGILYVQSKDGGFNPSALVNSGAYSGLNIQAGTFSLTFQPDTRGGYFLAKYTIESADGSKTRDAETVVRLMNG